MAFRPFGGGGGACVSSGRGHSFLRGRGCVGSVDHFCVRGLPSSGCPRCPGCTGTHVPCSTLRGISVLRCPDSFAIRYSGSHPIFRIRIDHGRNSKGKSTAKEFQTSNSINTKRQIVKKGSGRAKEICKNSLRGPIAPRHKLPVCAVSYTHLTLPTICSV